MSHIVSIEAREILDSRGNPTIESKVVTQEAEAVAKVPSGASTGSYEAVELRDNDFRYNGKGVMDAVRNINGPIADALTGIDVTDQRKIDKIMIDLDGTKNKAKLGANATIAVSMACCRTAAIESYLPLFRYLGGVAPKRMPVIMANVINGGKHANNNIDMQEYMLSPVGATNFHDALRMTAETFRALKSLLNERGFSTAVGDEGGFAPNLKNNKEPLEFMAKAVEKAGYKLGEDIKFAIDPASTSFFENGKYRVEGNDLSSTQMIDYYEELVNSYPIYILEDGLAEDDWDGWGELTERLGKQVMLIGDDIFVTNTNLIARGIEQGIANAVLIKLNQIGTVSETMDAIELAQFSGYKTVVSHRSGETDDSFIADLAVAKNCGFIKTGSVCRGERIAKYNRLTEIEDILKTTSIYG
ncbi:MAG: phosphopyruvate hydratase [Epsilonproteobacteria bacterium]|nr:phosphopyruvate hydratase [Campylobacterota bacterium]